MKLSPRIYAEALYAAVKTASGKELHAVARRFLQLLRRRRHFRMLPQIIRQFDEVLEREEGLVPVRVTTARTHAAEDERDWVRAAVLGVLPDEGKRRIELERQVDPDLVGGFVIRVKDRIIDGSVHSFVRQLREKLKVAVIQ